MNQNGAVNSKKCNDLYAASIIYTKNFKITYNMNYGNNVTNDTMFQIASCSKFITSIVVAKLYELKILDYDTDINKYLKKWKCPAKNITLRTLLSHTSGSNDELGYLGYEYNSILPNNINIINGEYPSKYGGINFVMKPGEKELYSGAGFQVVQQVLEELTTKKLYELMKIYIFDVLDLKNSTGKLLYHKKNKFNIANFNIDNYRLYPETAAAGVWMSSNDLLKIVIDLCHGYKNNTSKLLKKNTIDMILTRQKNSNEGLGPFVYVNPKNDRLVFAYNGWNEGYRMHFDAYPINGECKIILTNYNTQKVDGSKDAQIYARKCGLLKK